MFRIFQKRSLSQHLAAAQRPGVVERLHSAAVTAGRQPWLYTDGRIPDSKEGRFEAVSLHVALLTLRLLRDAGEEEQALSQGLFDQFFRTVEYELVEMGVGDMSLAKKVKKLFSAHNGRQQTLLAALSDEDRTALQDWVGRTLHQQTDQGAEARQRLAGWITAVHAYLDAVPLQTVLDEPQSALMPSADRLEAVLGAPESEGAAA